MNEDLQRVRDAISSGRISQRELSRLSGVKPSTLCLIASGETEDPKSGTLLALVHALDKFEEAERAATSPDTEPVASEPTKEAI